MHRPLRRLLIAALAATGLALGLTAAATGSTATAGTKAVTAPAPGSTTGCVSGPNSYCFAPEVSYVGPASECGATDYYGTRDASAIPIAWTYANPSVLCTTVTYYKPFAGTIPASTFCRVYFYDPNGDATATFALLAGTRNGDTIPLAPVNEAPASGWIHVATAANLSGYFRFTDEGQSYPHKIGWGTSVLHSIWVTC